MLLVTHMLLNNEFSLAATFVSHILQNSILSSVEKMSSSVSDKIAFKWHEVDGFDLGMVEYADKY